MATDTAEKKIEIDFSECRRRSFLPSHLADEFVIDPNAKSYKTSEYTEEDDTFMYLSDEENQYRPLKKFCTGSKYLGQWNKLGIAGKGIYKYPHGVIYDGYFNKKGEFHGTGILTYPNGQRIEGIWINGKIGEDCTFVTGAGVPMNKNYCVMPDRRYQIEIENDMAPVNQEYLTNEVPPPRAIPPDCYDLIEGFFDPYSKTVYKYPKVKPVGSDISLKREKTSSKRIVTTRDEEEDKTLPTDHSRDRCTMGYEGILEPKKIFWIPSAFQENWIVKNCRKSGDEPTGYRPDLYEEWTKGGSDWSSHLKQVSSSEFVSALESLQLTEKKEDSKKSHLMTFIRSKNEEAENQSLEMMIRINNSNNSRFKPRSFRKDLK